MRRRFMNNVKYTYTVLSNCYGGSITIDGKKVGVVPDSGVYVYETNKGGAKTIEISYFDSVESSVDSTVRERDCRYVGPDNISDVHDVYMDVSINREYIYIRSGLFENTYRETTTINYYSPNNATCLENYSVTMNKQENKVVTKYLIETQEISSEIPSLEQILKSGSTYVIKYYYTNGQYIDPKGDEYPNGINLVTSPSYISVDVPYWYDTYPKTVKCKFYDKEYNSKICWLTMTYN